MNTDRTRVIWTDAEKAKLVQRAVITQQEHPDLAGLPLLRSAMSALPASRRRKLIAVTQAPWFEPAVAAEIARRAATAKAEADHAAALNRGQERFIAFHEAWRAEQTANFKEQLRLLAAVVSELQALNKKLGLQVSDGRKR